MHIGIDLGGTKIEGLVLDRSGEERARRRIAAPRGSYQATLDALCTLVSALESQAGLATSDAASIGVGIPGAISRLTGRVKNANSTWLNGEALDRDLAERLRRPVRIENDANCMALSEATDGAAAGADPVFGVILGTGVGGALVIGGRPVRGAMSIAGEWGHNPLPPSIDRDASAREHPGPPCYCGRRGCVETWLSGPGFAADHIGSLLPGVGPREPSEPGPDPFERADFRFSPEALVAEARAGVPAAKASLERWLDRLARSLAVVINIVDPQVIVVAGGLSRIDELYLELPRRWSAYVFSDRVDTRIVPALHGDASGVRGAAWLGRV
jgi:fructokinase